jgi:hypothetical protein
MYNLYNLTQISRIILLSTLKILEINLKLTRFYTLKANNQSIGCELQQGNK